jgi:hypothetical protein
MRRMPGTETVLVRSHCALSQFHGANGFILPIAGLNMWLTAHLLYLLRSELPTVVESLLHMTL